MKTLGIRRGGAWLLTLAGIGLVVAVVRAQCVVYGADAANVQNLRQLSRALQLYAQDNDDILPPAETASVFRDAVLPYSCDPSVFVSPATGLAYAINPVLSRKPVASFGEPSRVEVARDPEGVPTELRLNGDVYQNGVLQLNSDANAQCVADLRRVAFGLEQYVQDYDETFPTTAQMRAPAQFQAAVFPYVRGSSLFICPVTNQAYLPNAALGGASPGSFDNFSTIDVLRDAAPHADGKINVAFFDGHIEHGGVTVPTPDVAGNPALANLANARQVGLAMIQYVQDYDERFPPLEDDARVRALLLPYTRNADVFFSTDTGLPYVFNGKLSGVSLDALPFPAQTVVFADRAPSDDGFSAMGYADGHARVLRTAGYRPTLAVTPADVLGGQPATATVTLNAPAPDGGVTVRLTSRSWAACVPDTIFVPAGQTTASFPVQTQPVGTETVANLEAATNRERHLGQLAIHPASVNGLTFNPNRVRAGAPTTATVTLDGPAPARGVSILLRASNQTLAQVMIPGGMSSGTATFSVKRGGIYLVTATLNGGTAQATLTVTIALHLLGDPIVIVKPTLIDSTPLGRVR